MIYYLFDYLNDLNVPGAGLFNYISFRAAMALLTSLIVSVFIGKRVIDLLRKQQIGETVRDLGLDGQIEKTGTPTMGGLIILGAILIPTLLFARLENVYVITMIIATVWLGMIGFIDDYIKVFKKNKEGLKGKFKVVGQIGVGLIVGSVLYFSDDVVVHKRVASDYSLKEGEITIFRVSKARGRHQFFVMKGQVLDRPNSFSGTSGVINLGENSAHKLEQMFKGGLEHHVAFTYGDISDKLIHFGQQMDIPTYTL